MNDSIRKKRNNLCIKSQQLRSLALDRGDKAKDMRKEQDKIHAKWEFYDKFIKANERMKQLNEN